MPTTTTFNGAGMSLRQKLAAAGEIVCRTCPTCGGSGSGSGGINICGCNVTNGLCLHVENNDIGLFPPLVGQLPLEGTFVLTETTWEAVVADYEYNVVCTDLTDPEDPITISDEWFFNPSAYLTNPGGRWFTTDWQLDDKGFFDGGISRAADGKPIYWKHVIHADATGCPQRLYTFSRIPDDVFSGTVGHTTIKTWGHEFVPGNPFYYQFDDEGSPIRCITQTVSNNPTAGTIPSGSSSCPPLLIELQVNSTFGNVILLWDTGADNVHIFDSALWSIYECG